MCFYVCTHVRTGANKSSNLLEPELQEVAGHLVLVGTELAHPARRLRRLLTSEPSLETNYKPSQKRPMMENVLFPAAPEVSGPLRTRDPQVSVRPSTFEFISPTPGPMVPWATLLFVPMTPAEFCSRELTGLTHHASKHGEVLQCQMGRPWATHQP